MTLEITGSEDGGYYIRASGNVLDGQNAPDDIPVLREGSPTGWLKGEPRVTIQSVTVSERNAE